MSKLWKAEVAKMMRTHGFGHRCTTEHAFIRHSCVALRSIAELNPVPARLLCINHVPMLTTTEGFAAHAYALLFVWNQPVQDIEHALVTLLLRKPSHAIPCICWVNKKVRDAIPHSSQASGISLPNVQLARFLALTLEHNVNV